MIKLDQIFVRGPKDAKRKEEESISKDKEQGFDQKGYDAIQSKIQKQPFEVDIRIAASAQTQDRAEEILNHLTSAFGQFSMSAINSLEPKEVYKKELQKLTYDFSFRIFTKDGSRTLAFHYFDLEKLERCGVRSGVRSVIK